MKKHFSKRVTILILLSLYLVIVLFCSVTLFHEVSRPRESKKILDEITPEIRLTYTYRFDQESDIFFLLSYYIDGIIDETKTLDELEGFIEGVSIFLRNDTVNLVFPYLDLSDSSLDVLWSNLNQYILNISDKLSLITNLEHNELENLSEAYLNLSNHFNRNCNDSLGAYISKGVYIGDKVETEITEINNLLSLTTEILGG